MATSTAHKMPKNAHPEKRKERMDKLLEMNDAQLSKETTHRLSRLEHTLKKYLP